MVGSGGELRTIEGGGKVFEAANDSRVEFRHVFEGQFEKQHALSFPQCPPTFGLRVSGTEQWASQLRGLIHQKRQHHQHHQDRREMPESVSVIVLEMVALVLERVERFVFNLPACSTAALNQRQHCCLGFQRQVGHPTEHRRSVTLFNGARHEIDQQIRVRFVQWQVLHRRVTLSLALVRVIRLPSQREALIDGLGRSFKQKCVITGLGTQDKVHFVVPQILNVRSVRGQPVFHDNESQVWMIFSNVAQKTSCRVSFTIILLTTVLTDNRFRAQGDHFANKESRPTPVVDP